MPLSRVWESVHHRFFQLYIEIYKCHVASHRIRSARYWRHADETEQKLRVGGGRGGGGKWEEGEEGGGTYSTERISQTTSDTFSYLPGIELVRVDVRIHVEVTFFQYPKGCSCGAVLSFLSPFELAFSC